MVPQMNHLKTYIGWDPCDGLAALKAYTAHKIFDKMKTFVQKFFLMNQVGYDKKIAQVLRERKTADEPENVGLKRSVPADGTKAPWSSETGSVQSRRESPPTHPETSPDT